MLTKRENQVMALVKQGLTNAEIASKLGVKPTTIEWHLTSAYRKLGARNRVEALSRWACKHV